MMDQDAGMTIMIIGFCQLLIAIIVIASWHICTTRSFRRQVSAEPIAKARSIAVIGSMEAAAPRKQILTDADTGADDALSILIGCALADVLAISCTDGNVSAETATGNTLGLLEAAGLAAPVAQGLTWPSSEGRG